MSRRSILSRMEPRDAPPLLPSGSRRADREARRTIAVGVVHAGDAHCLERPRCSQIETPAGTLTAKAVIVTASTNALLSGKIKFAPDLPKRQQDAAAKA